MGRVRPTRLRESEQPAPKGAKVIDAKFEVIGRRTIWRRIWFATLTVLAAAALGFAVPQLWIFSQRLGEFLGGQ